MWRFRSSIAEHTSFTENIRKSLCIHTHTHTDTLLVVGLNRRQWKIKYKSAEFALSSRATETRNGVGQCRHAPLRPHIFPSLSLSLFFYFFLLLLLPVTVKPTSREEATPPSTSVVRAGVLSSLSNKRLAFSIKLPPPVSTLSRTYRVAPLYGTLHV